MIRCERCGFPNTRPGIIFVGGVCQSCLNEDKKQAMIKSGEFKSRQEWLTKYIQENKTHERYDCVVAVSGGKDSHTIVRRLIENHGVRNPLLVTVTDEFTHSKAGLLNINNLVNKYDLDHITFRCKPITFKHETLRDFQNELHPLKWIEEKIYATPIEIAKAYGIKVIFFGENSDFEYGSGDDLYIFYKNSDDKVRVIYMGAIYPYSIKDSLKVAKEIGFVDLVETNDWRRAGSIEDSTQIDSVAYVIQLWTKFVKFGFQRVSDIACRLVREGTLTKDQALKLIEERDYICDPMAKTDFCNTIRISEMLFDEIVDRHANKDLVEQDINGQWRLK